MLAGLWYFHCIFLVELLHGVYTPSLRDLGHSTWKKGYCLIVLFILCFLILWQIQGEIINVNCDYTNILWLVADSIVCAVSIIHALTDYRTKISALMNLVAVENMLDTEIRSRHFHFVHCLFSGVLIFFIVRYLFIICFATIFLPIGMFIIVVYLNGLLLCLFSGCCGLLLKIYSINRRIEEKLRKEVKKLTGRYFRQLNHGQLDSEDENSDLGQIISLMRQTEGIIHKTEEEISSWYRVYVLWMVLIAAILTPYNVIHFFKFNVVGSIASVALGIFMLTSIFMIILCGQQIQQSKRATMTVLTELMVSSERQEDRRALTHRLLASCHRGYNFNCYLVDFGTPLLAAILEISLLVFTSY